MANKITRSHGQEPSMFLQRPSTGKSQDVRHVLTQTFRELYTRDAIRTETVKNLQVSKGSDDPYHEKYVESLQKIYEEWQRRMDEAAMLERHIMQAQARSTLADERELNRISKSCDAYDVLGLPPCRAHFSSCIDTELLKKHHLLTPDDYGRKEIITSAPPSAPLVPSYICQTATSQQHNRLGGDRIQTPLPDLPDMHLDDFSDLSNEECDIIHTELGEDISKHDEWKKQMHEEQREMDRKDLANLQAKVHYLRNPRCVPKTTSTETHTLIKTHKRKPKEIGINDKRPEPRPKEPVPIFQPSPPVIIFTNYAVGEVYETVLELKNVSTVLRQCRVLPLSTQYFAVGLGQFPGEHGLVAPGMSCKYPVRFVPDSLCDYDDYIVIQTQSPEPLIVPVKGCREPPSLALPSTIDVGCCLVGGCHVTQYVVVNDGGPGRFCIIPSSSWPATNFRSVVTNGVVMLHPFEVQPSSFELGKGQSGVIEIMFTPNLAKEFTQELVLICDNCQVKHVNVKGQGEIAKVELVSVEHGLSEHMLGELHDTTAEHFIRFDELNPFTYTDRNISVHNCTNVELPFQWMVYKPQMQPPDMEADEVAREQPEDRIPDLDAVFSVHPPSGTLAPDQTMDFKATFAPPVLGEFHDVLHMMLQQVPHISETASTKSERRLSVTSEEDGISDIFPSSIVQYRDVTGLEIEAKGSAVTPNVVLHPYAMYVPGPHLVGTTIKKLFTMANHSFSVITFQWEPHTEKHIIEVEPPNGELDPGMAVDLELGLTGVEPGKISTTLYCYVMNMDEPLALHVEFEVKGPELTIREPDINFGLVRLGQSVTKEMTLTNQSQVTTPWTVTNCPAPICNTDEDPMAPSEFVFTPSCGELKPLETKVVCVSFTPKNPKTVKRIFEVGVENGNKCCIDCFAEVQAPTVCLLECVITLTDHYVGVPHVTNVFLYNQGLLPTQFQWGEAKGDDAEDCSIEFDQKSGVIGPREKKQIRLDFCAKREGQFTDIQIPCAVDGMDCPLCLNLSCCVKGLSVSLKISVDGTEQCEGLQIDFGNNVPLGSAPKRFLHVKNESAITTPFHIAVEYFIAKPPSPPEKKGEETPQSRRKILGRTPNLADPFSKTACKAQAEFYKAMLMQGNGAAFLPTPSSGLLQPFAEEVIEVTAYCDTWGQYTDNIILKVGHLEPMIIPVSMTAVGCPLQFQMFAAKPELQPVVRFGTHVAGVAPVRRKVRVNNNSPFEIRIDWVLFNVEQNDTKLIDLNICYSRPFPLRDSHGNVVIATPVEEPEPISRVPSDYIPNSSDTTPNVSDLDLSMLEATPSCDEMEESEKRSKLISLYVRQHEGKKSLNPYSIDPPQMSIAAHSYAIVMVQLMPFPAIEVDHEIDCNGFALGYMSVDGKAAGVPRKVSRTEAFEVQTLRLEMTSHLKPALLTIEHGDEDGMVYQSAMSDLLDRNNSLMPESLRACSMLLLNNTETPVTFRMKVNKPFWIVELDPSTNVAESTRALETNMHTLKPQHNLLVKVALKITKELLAIYNVVDDNDDDDDDTEHLNDSKMYIHDKLEIEFNNSTSQIVKLQASIAIPQFELSKHSLNFGTCLVGQQREMEFIISNQTASHSFWTASIESQSDTCAPETFTVTPSSSLLEARITHVSNSKLLLKVHFTAKHAEEYEAVFLFVGTLGEEPQRLIIRGTGSYDGKYMAVMDI
ncbi:deleted in lung and esophageal cancer protein 1-like [Gigantopelta aegis]|uniref:deleted in lung and esophageal cancer protein 1-like n=1 Tax=Gigantopelta aegis TaxID=1735272 RepID=UPI001B88B176|nr:deleted in lung and esophageal cancer protein 1-like [Gigantopelta aegis]